MERQPGELKTITPTRNSLFSISLTHRQMRSLMFSLGLPILIVVLAIGLSIVQPRFATPSNIQNLARQASVLAIMATGQAFPILVGGLDISVGAQIAVVSIISAMSSKVFGVVPAYILGILAGTTVGAVNGFLVSRLRLSPIIVTLGTLSILRGLALVITQGKTVRDLPEDYTALGTGFLGPIAVPTVVAGLVAVMGYILLTRTRFGRYVYAIGGNEEAARLSGINVAKYKMLAYVACGAATGIAGIVLSSRVGSGEPNLGYNMELDAIASVFIGGVAWGGGEGSLIGVLLGVTLFSLLSNGLNLLAVPSYIQSMIIGALIILAVGAASLQQRSN